ncbi:MAG: hypothetical protein H6719_13025 [Sandaracinaceae bacterium]|nr:hypothetical protein [Sandaracinaceae bacterium]
MSQAKSSGNGCLYALLGLGVLMVGAGAALELLPDELPTIEQESLPPPAPPVYEPEPPPEDTALPQRDPLGEPVRDLEDLLGDALDEEPTRTLLWHAEAPGEPATACVLRLEATAQTRRPRGEVTLLCADGRRFTGRVDEGQLIGRPVSGGVAFRADLRFVMGTDDEGVAASLRVSTGEHELVVSGSASFDGPLFVEELSVTAAASPGETDAASTTPVVRLAVPTVVSGAIPIPIALVRGTGPEPRPEDPVCELVVSPALSRSYNCRVVLRCHGETIYGAGTTGYNDCQVSGPTVLTATDTGTTPENQDPTLDLDLPNHRLVVGDATAAGTWSATFDLVVDPRLGQNLEYRGGYRGDADGSWSMRPFATPATMTFDEEPAQPLTATSAQLGRGEYTIATDGVPGLPLVFGRNGRGVAGYVGDRAVWGFAR